MDSPLMEPLLDPIGHAPAVAATPDEHGVAAGNESSTVVGDGTDADGSRITGVASAHAEENDDGDDVEGDEMSASMQRRLDESSAVEGEDEEEVGDDAEADEMAARMERRLAALPGRPHESEPFTIFRVAGPMRDRNRHLYEPQMVSLGPFHRGAGRHLDAMEAHK
ncbi:hypothetical protein C2845_PM14G19520 [Panicum miliaceum]|uniref:Uncharacterized protein n=1 Tax=Panicum miliaceum TaxID=4540 RepID=A0A3L6PNL1_PANMI|nr:hypothetical protein C2845_PM14G19520 [Panicum miliaceum]